MPDLSTLNQFEKVATGLNFYRSGFNRNFSYTTTFKAGDIVPLGYDEVLPGDTFKVDARFILRNFTPIVPVMDASYIDIYAFYVPNRIIAPLNGDDWEEICGENKTGAWAPSVEKTVTLRSASSSAVVKNHSLLNYLGLPINFDVGSSKLNPYLILAYYMIYDEWFRNENVTAPFLSTYNADNISSLMYYASGNVGGPSSNNGVKKATKFPDLFTSCLPAPQKGDSVTIGISGLAPLTTGEPYTGLSDLTWNTGSNVLPFTAGFGGISSTNARLLDAGIQTRGDFQDSIYPNNLYADLSSATSTTINALINAFSVQALLMRDARAGSRFREILKAHFGVTIADSRVQVPEYLGGVRRPINIMQVTQTSATTDTSALGFTGAFSNTYAEDLHFVNKSFAEHGIILYLGVVRTHNSYSQGVDKFWTRYRRFDYYWSSFASLGEQPIFKDEIYATSVDPTSTTREVFGYNEAWVHYRTHLSMITGSVSPNANDNSFASWTYAESLSSAPALTDNYLEQSADVVDKTLVADTDDQFLIQIYYTNKTVRILPVNSIPGLSI